jgi:hypothetical protein
MRRRPVIAAVLALLLNLGGGPMAWAQLAPADSDAAPAVPCPMHEASASVDAGTAHAALPSCCAAGGCACAALPVPPIVPALQAPFMIAIAALVPPGRGLAPSALLADPLRPPIV